MKKTLFAMLAVALMGGQAFGAEFSTSDYENKMFGQPGSGITGKYKYSVNEDATVNVDSSVVTGNGSSAYSQSFNGKTTVVFNGADSWNICCQSLTFNNSVNITSTAEAAQSWIDIFANTPGAQITLITGISETTVNFGSSVLLEGVARGGKITLQGTTDTVEFTYLGQQISSDFTPNDGEIALRYVFDSDSQTRTWFLTGALPKSSSVPEPATATLSLMALAGLASRRRRK